MSRKATDDNATKYQKHIALCCIHLNEKKRKERKAEEKIPETTMLQKLRQTKNNFLHDGCIHHEQETQTLRQNALIQYAVISLDSLKVKSLDFCF